MEQAYRRKRAWGKTDEQDRKGNLHGANSFTPAGGMPARLPDDLANEPDHSNGELIYLSLQFPGWPRSPLHRMMMFVFKESPAQ